MDPPVFYSSFIKMSDDITAGGLKIKKGDLCTIGMGHISHNPNEFHTPSEFIPERFDPKSHYYKRPDGGRRNPYSSSPFLSLIHI